MIKATFSNGRTVEYKGNRAVTAAWMVIDENGEVWGAGFSMDAKLAESRAKGAVAETAKFAHVPRRFADFDTEMARAAYRGNKERGHNPPSKKRALFDWLHAQNDRVRREAMAGKTIEVVAVERG